MSLFDFFRLSGSLFLGMLLRLLVKPLLLSLILKLLLALFPRCFILCLALSFLLLGQRIEPVRNFISDNLQLVIGYSVAKHHTRFLVPALTRRNRVEISFSCDF